MIDKERIGAFLNIYKIYIVTYFKDSKKHIKNFLKGYITFFALLRGLGILHNGRGDFAFNDFTLKFSFNRVYNSRLELL